MTSNLTRVENRLCALSCWCSSSVHVRVLEMTKETLSSFHTLSRRSDRPSLLHFSISSERLVSHRRPEKLVSLFPIWSIHWECSISGHRGDRSHRKKRAACWMEADDSAPHSSWANTSNKRCYKRRVGTTPDIAVEPPSGSASLLLFRLFIIINHRNCSISSSFIRNHNWLFPSELWLLRSRESFCWSAEQRPQFNR